MVTHPDPTAAEPSEDTASPGLFPAVCLHCLLGLLTCGPAAITIKSSSLCFNKSKSDELICHKYKVFSRLSCCNSLGPEVIDHLSSDTSTARDLKDGDLPFAPHAAEF